jgi:hypothetical protein
MVVDTDNPASASPLALANAVEGCGALVTTDFARADAPQLLPDTLPWIAWVTTPRIPAYVPSAAHDALLLADPMWRAKAQAQGWPAQRLAVASWPVGTDAAPLPAQPVAALIADTKPLAPPERLEDYSSHRLLWEQVAAELTANPFAAIDDPEGYLATRRQRAGIDETGFDHRSFLVDLIAPAVAQGLARLMLEVGVPLRLHGKGWAEIETFSRAATGAVASREELLAATIAATILIDPRPLAGPHPMHTMGRAVIRAAPRQTARKLVDLVRQMLASPPVPAMSVQQLSFEQIKRLL